MVKNSRTNTLPILSTSSSLAMIDENMQKRAHLYLGEFPSRCLISASPCRLVYQLRSTLRVWPIRTPGFCSCDTIWRGFTLEKSNVLSMADTSWANFFPRLSSEEEQSEWKRGLKDGLEWCLYSKNSAFYYWDVSFIWSDWKLLKLPILRHQLLLEF